MNLQTKIISFFKICIIVLLTFTLLGCVPDKRGENEIIVGTIAGPETDLMRQAAEVAKKQYGLKIRIIEFEDYILPNAALAEGSIDANMFQHQAYLDNAKRIRNYPIQSIGKTFIYPMAIYSKKYQSLDDLPLQATVGVPNDPSNETRALLLLQEARLISVIAYSTDPLTLRSITNNPKQLKFRELDAAQLPRSLDDLDIAVINTNYALPAGLSPSKDALVTENKNSPYANIVVVREDEINEEKYQKLMKALHSKWVVDFAKQLFGEEAIPAW